MKWIVVGLGNPGAEYAQTRHNAGRLAVELLAKKNGVTEWRTDKKANALVSSHEIGKDTVVCVLPDTFMNRSGSAVMRYVTSVKAAERLIVVQDDLDLPLGRMKLSFGRGAGGHKGVDSIMRAIKTKDFTRIRVGVSPHTASGKIKKVHGEDDVVDFVIGSFKPKEQEELKKVLKESVNAIEAIIEKGPQSAMSEFN